MHRSHTTAPQGFLVAQRLPPIPMQGVGPAQGWAYPPEGRAAQCAHARFPRPTNRSGGVPRHRSHGDVESGVAHTQGVLWVYAKP